MGGHEARSYWEDWGLLLLWTSFFLAPAGWFFDQGLGYALTKWICASGDKWLFAVTTGMGLAMTIGGAALAWSLLVKARAGREDGGAQIDRSQFLALVALGFNVLTTILLVTATSSRFILSPCE